MKRSMFALMLTIASLFCFTQAFGAVAEYTAVWNANSEADLAGYKLYVDVNGVETVTDVGNVTTAPISVTIPDGAVSVITVTVTAYDTSQNESLRSEAVIKTEDFEPPQPPDGLIVTLVRIITAALKWLASFFA